MSAFDDYIKNLEGQENVDPTIVALNLGELHVQELSTREAKINELNESVAGRDAELGKRDQDIAKWKAMNFDLAMQIPGQGANSNEPNADSDEKPNGSNITIGDLFTDKVRNRHGLR